MEKRQRSDRLFRTHSLVFGRPHLCSSEIGRKTDPNTGLLVKLQDDHPVNKMIRMDFHGFGPIWGPDLRRIWVGFGCVSLCKTL